MRQFFNREEPVRAPRRIDMPAITGSMKTNPDHRAEGETTTNRVLSSEQSSQPALVACFLLPPEQVEGLISMLQTMAALPAGTAAALSSSFGTTASTSEALWLAHFEAARYLGISTSTLYRYAEQERIECRKIGNRLEYRRSGLDRFRENQIRPARRSRPRGIIASTLGSGN
jgi:excisionase family DNA binding protein